MAAEIPPRIAASKPLPKGDTTNHFNVLVDNIYSYQEIAHSNLINSIYDALVEGTPKTTGTGTPVDTGTLKTNWFAGIIPNKGKYTERPKDGSSVPFVNHKSENYGFNRKYYIWNHTPYLALVNAGDTRKGKGTGPKENIKFIEKAIKLGTANAIEKGKFTKKSAAIAKLNTMPWMK